MPHKLSSIAPGWWDYTTIDDDIIEAAARLTPENMLKLSRPGFKVVFYDTLEEFYLAEALEYINAWIQSTEDNPVGICGPIGPTEQLPLVARLVNELNRNVRSAHFWGWTNGFSTGGKCPRLIRCHLKRRTANFASIAFAKNSECRMRTCIFRKRTRRPTAKAGTPACAAS